MEAVENHQDTTRSEDYHQPELRHILPYLTSGDMIADGDSTVNSTLQEQEDEEFDPEVHSKRFFRKTNRRKRRSLSSMSAMMKESGSKAEFCY